MKIFDIGEIADRSGIPPSTLRYYEESGLITSVARHGLRRQFGPETLLQLTLISMGKAAGFSLKEISGMFRKDGTPDLPRTALRERADKLDRQIRDLTALRNALKHVADCRAPSHLECPKFRRLLRVAAVRGRRKDRRTLKPGR
jgi:DNA-binding transcriptional MerR regulator